MGIYYNIYIKYLFERIGYYGDIRNGKRFKVRELLFEIQHELEELFGDKLKDRTLYGSFARQTNRENSDIDIAVLLNGKYLKLP